MIYCNFARFDYMKICRRHISIALFCLYILAVGLMCFTRPENIPPVAFDWFGLTADKIVHFLMFIPFPILAGFAFVPERYGKTRKTLCIVAIVALATATAIATEKIQGILGYRSFEIRDLVADLAGIAAGTSAILTFIVFKTGQK